MSRVTRFIQFTQTTVDSQKFELLWDQKKFGVIEDSRNEFKTTKIRKLLSLLIK